MLQQTFVAQTPAGEPVPPPPPAPLAPEAPQVTVITTTDGTVPAQAIPRSAQDIQGLRERREILRDQLDRANNRRSELVGQLEVREGEQPLPAEARVGVQQRISQLDERIGQIERDQAMTERLLTSAPPAVLAQAAVADRRMHDQMDEDDAAAAAFFAFGFGVVLTLAISRIRRRFKRGAPSRAGAMATPLPMMDDPRIDRLNNAVDAIAEEVERIGEGQRFVTQLLANRPPQGQVVGVQSASSSNEGSFDPR